MNTAYSLDYTVFDYPIAKHSDHNLLLLAVVNVSCVCYVLLCAVFIAHAVLCHNAMICYLYMPTAPCHLLSLCTAIAILSDQQYTLEMLLSSPFTSLP